MLSEADLNIIFYFLILLIGLPISYKYAVFTVKNTGMVIPHFFISLMINLCFGVLCIIGWMFFAVRVNEFFFIGGIFLGGAVTFLSLIVLLLLLLMKRKSMLNHFHEHDLK